MTWDSETGSLALATLREAYARGDASPAEVVRAIYRRIDAYPDPAVWIHLRPEADVLAEVERRPAQAGPLWGVPFAVKDNIDVAGLPTTAACPGFAHTAARTAPAVQRLLDAGAVLVGKTNLDQFATGLVGVRSPYGAPRCVFDDRYVSGGSSSGSAVAVAAGLVSFALGTDTAGSGRVPAGFNNIVGVKPSKGLVSTTGVVPACRSLDCVSVFSLTVPDGMAVLEVMAAPDPEDFLSRAAPGPLRAAAAPPTFRFGVPRPADRAFFGDAAAEAAFDRAIARLEQMGGTAVAVDYRPFLEVARLLYAGPWVAERWAAVGDFAEAHPEAVHPVTRGILEGALAYDATSAFRGSYRLATLAREIAPVWREIDTLVVPTAPTHYTVAELEADPLTPNANLGTYTNFANLLDLCALAVPNGFRPDGLPTGITFIAPALRDAAIAALGARYHAAIGGRAGKTATPVPPAPEPAPTAPTGTMALAVVGAHLSGMPLNKQLLDLGATFLREARTAPAYRLYALPNRTPPAPGLIRTGDDGEALLVEVWAVPMAGVGSFLAGIAPPLGLGTVTLEDGSAVKGFICEAYGLQGAEDITRFGGWRAWRAAVA